MIVKFLADGTLFLIILICFPVITWSIRRQFWSVAPVITMAGLTALLVAKIMSLVYQPEVARPFMEAGKTAGAAYINNPGFPSDHMLLATVLVGAVIVLTKHRGLATLLIVLTLLMGLGRVLALVHTPLDILGGIVAGVSGMIWYLSLTKHSKQSSI